MPGLTKNPSKRTGEKAEDVKPKKERKVSLKVVENKKQTVSSVSKITRKKKESNEDNKEELQVKPVAAKTKKEVASGIRIALKKKDSTKDNKEKLQIKPVAAKTKKEVTSKKVPKVVKKKKAGDPSKESKKMGKVLNGSLSEKKTGGIYIGYHASIAGGVQNALIDSVSVGARCLALFLAPQRTWASKPLKPEHIQEFRKFREENEILPNMILPHGSYLLNLGSPNPELRQKSLDLLVDELERCEELGILLFNIHPGKARSAQLYPVSKALSPPGSSVGKISRAESIRHIADGINAAHLRTEGSGVRVVLENMSCQGNTIGGDLRELKSIIDLVEDPARVGVCLDTCHAMAAGYDLSSQAGFDKLLREFEEFVGWKWLVGCHINDSMGPVGCHRDRHQNIGQGTIGLDGFRRIVNCPHFTDIPLILETPLSEKIGIKRYKQEMELLMSLTTKKKK